MSMAHSFILCFVFFPPSDLSMIALTHKNSLHQDCVDQIELWKDQHCSCKQHVRARARNPPFLSGTPLLGETHVMAVARRQSLKSSKRPNAVPSRPTVDPDNTHPTTVAKRDGEPCAIRRRPWAIRMRPRAAHVVELCPRQSDIHNSRSWKEKTNSPWANISCDMDIILKLQIENFPLNFAQQPPRKRTRHHE